MRFPRLFGEVGFMASMLNVAQKFPVVDPLQPVALATEILATQEGLDNIYVAADQKEPPILLVGRRVTFCVPTQRQAR
jgi:hypothetical protein